MRYSVFIYLETNSEHHGEFEPGKVQYSNPNFIDLLFLIIETQNLGKEQTLPALAALNIRKLQSQKSLQKKLQTT